ncbi:MAG TPA: hypothetical protein PLV50_12635 [Smithella sp.]|nr:hypothetical protein [Smithella sp.]HOG91380.1 hypothetical protein [Smithella sp.]
MHQVVRKHWKNGFRYWHGATGKNAYWSYSFRIGKIGIIINRPSKIAPFINLYEII